MIKSVNQHDRQTLRSLTACIPVSKTAIIKHMKKTKILRARSSWLKPFITPVNIKERLKFAMSYLRPRSDGNHCFVNMFDYVHVDEKWFYLTKAKKKFYVYDDEEKALRSCKSKLFITKIMLLAAVARPRFDINKKCIFDGKIGAWPFVEQSPAARSSKPKRNDVDDDGVGRFGAIKSKMPRSMQRRGVIIQQDNATPHRCVSTEMLKDSRIHGVKVSNQPPNSPDFNVLDLGFFIQSLQHQKKTQTIDDLIGAVENAFY
ncbi:Aste57867_8953 [Aphanomyces stellatus]|uniref:Aste57867_8953 protein n=1 Tax=Aphanomyces stellatus TaxID=120398 RepID=A0A485KLS6_9STRA|nr:hypothetical protein As57867_008918 [Aphanomyces stellatus]VFT85837.1 Aste57867_8953 [Aphanomyces stellatus]